MLWLPMDSKGGMSRAKRSSVMTELLWHDLTNMLVISAREHEEAAEGANAYSIIWYDIPYNNQHIILHYTVLHNTWVYYINM